MTYCHCFGTNQNNLPITLNRFPIDILAGAENLYTMKEGIAKTAVKENETVYEHQNVVSSLSRKTIRD